MSGVGKHAKHRASTIYKKFHNAVSHEEQVIAFNYFILLVVLVIYTVIGMAYYASLYADVDDDVTLSVAPYSWFRALYFLTITMTSIGYGEMKPTTPGPTNKQQKQQHHHHHHLYHHLYHHHRHYHHLYHIHHHNHYHQGVKCSQLFTSYSVFV